MDSLTHIAIGACIGEAIAGKKIGKRAMLWGAFANSLPDLDFIASFWLPMDRNLLAHRGLTHSIFFSLLVAPLLAWLAYRWHKQKGMSYPSWILFIGIEIFCHLFLDLFNNYGVGLLEPFSQERFSFNTLYVFDLIFTFPALLAAILLFIKRTPGKMRRSWWRFGVMVPALYLAYCSYNKLKVDQEVRSMLHRQNIGYNSYFTTPAPLNSWLWYVVAATDSGMYSGYRSVFDSEDSLDLTWFPKNEYLLTNIRDKQDIRSVENLERFSQGFYTAEKWNDTLVFNDLRFGQIVGWYDPKEKFVFHYFIGKGFDNKMAVQRGRFARWNKETIGALLKRIQGN
jgi:inner membrane protein